MKLSPVSFSASQPLKGEKGTGLFITNEPKLSPVLKPKSGTVADIFIKEEPNKNKNNISFGYSNVLKTLWKKGKLPTVTRGFYGGRLTKGNCTLEHLQCASKGGKTVLGNLVLATKENNCARGDKPLKEAFNLNDMSVYLKQFVDVQVENFNGNEYIKSILKKVSEIL